MARAKSGDSGSGSPLKKLILLVLLFGMVGVLAELLLIGHTEDRNQWIPLIALGVGMIAVVLRLLRPGRGTTRLLAVVMTAFVVTGVLGLYYHVSGNREFELEIYPSMTGFELFSEAMMGATPALAPGTMVLLGLIGLVVCVGEPHPKRDSS